MRALQRVADKVCCTRPAKTLFMKLGSLIMKESDESKVMLMFRVLSGESPLKTLPQEITEALPSTAFSVDTQAWTPAKSWVQWWATPVHLSM